MKHTDIKILNKLNKIRNKEKLSYKKMNALVEQVFKPYLVVETDADGYVCSKDRFETLEGAIAFMEFRDYGFKMSLYDDDYNNNIADGVYPILIRKNNKYYDRKDCCFVIDIYEWLKSQTEINN